MAVSGKQTVKNVWLKCSLDSKLCWILWLSWFSVDSTLSPSTATTTSSLSTIFLYLDSLLLSLSTIRTRQENEYRLSGCVIIINDDCHCYCPNWTVTIYRGTYIASRLAWAEPAEEPLGVKSAYIKVIITLVLRLVLFSCSCSSCFTSCFSSFCFSYLRNAKHL